MYAVEEKYKIEVQSVLQYYYMQYGTYVFGLVSPMLASSALPQLEGRKGNGDLHWTNPATKELFPGIEIGSM